jgi:hypothetical protein
MFHFIPPDCPVEHKPEATVPSGKEASKEGAVKNGMELKKFQALCIPSRRSRFERPTIAYRACSIFPKVLANHFRPLRWMGTGRSWLPVSNSAAMNASPLSTAAREPADIQRWPISLRKI